MNNDTFIRLLVTLLILYSCSSRQHTNAEIKYFRDVDIYLLKGIDEVNASDLPNVGIADSANHRIVIYQARAAEPLRRDYRAEGGKWVLTFFEKDDTATIYTTRVIYPNKLLEFDFTDTAKTKLFDVGTLIGDTMKYFRPNDFINSTTVKITDTSLSTITGAFSVKFWKASRDKHTEYFKEFGGDAGKLVHPIVTCYPALERSPFWWYEMQNILSPIPCQ